MRQYWPVLLLVGVLLMVPFWRLAIEPVVPIPFSMLVGWYFPFAQGGWDGAGQPLVFKGGLFAFDVVRQMLPWQLLSNQLISQGQPNWWNPYQFSGEPLLANPQLFLFSPLQLFFRFAPDVITGWTLLIVSTPLLMGLGMYLLARELQLSKPASLLTALSLGMSNHVLAWLEWGVVTNTLLFVPWLMVAGLWCKSRPRIGVVVLAFATLGVLTGGYPQEGIYGFIAAGVVVAMTLKRGKTPRKAWWFLGLGLILGFVLSLSQLLPTFRLYQYSALNTETSQALFERTRLHPIRLIGALAPELFGNRITETYWADRFDQVDYANAALFIGTPAILLALFGLGSKQHLRTVALTLLGIGLIPALPWWGSDVLMLLKLPLLATGVASASLVVAVLGLSFLAGLGVDRLKSQHYSLWISLGVVLVLLAFLLVSPGEVKNTVAKQVALSVSLIVATSVVLRFAIRYPRYALLVVFVLAVVEYAWLADRLLSFSPRIHAYPDHIVFDKARELAGLNRTTGIWDGQYPTNLDTVYGLYSAEGYNPLHLVWYQELFSFASGSYPQLTRSDADFPFETNEANAYRLMDITSTNTVIAKVTTPSELWEVEPLKYSPDRFELEWQLGAFKIYTNKKALERSFVATRVEVIPDSQERLQTMFSPDFSPDSTAILETPIRVATLASGSAQIVSYQPTQVRLEVEISTGPALVVLTDTYYPMWEVYIDGQPAQMLRVNHAFRGVVVEEGSHQVEWEMKQP